MPEKQSYSQKNEQQLEKASSFTSYQINQKPLEQKPQSSFGSGSYQMKVAESKNASSFGAYKAINQP